MIMLLLNFWTASSLTIYLSPPSTCILRTILGCSTLCVCRHCGWINRNPGILCLRDRYLHKKKCTFEQPDQEIIVTFIVFGQTFDFTQSTFNADLGEFIRSFSHVVDGEIIGFEKLEIVDAKTNNWANLEISVNQISSLTFVFMFLSLQKFASPNSWVFVSILEYLNCIISTEKWHYEFSVMLIFVLRNQSSLISENILIICEDFSHIFFGWFGLKTKNTSQRIFRSSITIEGRNLMFNWFFLNCFWFFEAKINSKFVLEVGFSEIISINNSALSSKDIDGFSFGKITGGIVFLPLETHTGVDSVDSLLG